MPEIEHILETLGLPWAYRFFREYKGKPLPEPPFAIYMIPHEECYGSDDENFVKKYNITVALYCKKKDFELEGKLEGLLCRDGIEFDKSEDFLFDESVFAITYEMEIVKKI